MKAKPTLALATKMAEAKGYAITRLYRLSVDWSASVAHSPCGPGIIHIYAPTRTAAIAGLTAVIDALPKRGEEVKLSTTGIHPVTLELARDRLLGFAWSLTNGQTLFGPAHLARIIWPGHRMRAQGAGLAAVSVMKRLGMKMGLTNSVPRRLLWDLSSLKKDDALPTRKVKR